MCIPSPRQTTGLSCRTAPFRRGACAIAQRWWILADVWSSYKHARRIAAESHGDRSGSRADQVDVNREGGEKVGEPATHKPSSTIFEEHFDRLLATAFELKRLRHPLIVGVGRDEVGVALVDGRIARPSTERSQSSPLAPRQSWNALSRPCSRQRADEPLVFPGTDRPTWPQQPLWHP